MIRQIKKFFLKENKFHKIDVVIVSALERTPIGAYKGSLKNIQIK